MTPFLHLPCSHLLLQLNHSIVNEIWRGGGPDRWKASIRTKLQAPTNRAFSKPGKEKGVGVGWGEVKTPKQNSSYFRMSTPCQVSFLLSFSRSSFFSIWLPRTKDPRSSTDCIYTIRNVRMSMRFYVHNANGKAFLDLWSCSHRMHGKGEGTGRPTASYHIYVKNRPFSKLYH